MKKIILCSFFIILLIGCSIRKQKTLKIPYDQNINSSEIIQEIKTHSLNEIVSIEINSIFDISRFGDEDVISKEKIEYFPESDVIKNISSFNQNEMFFKLFNKPFKNLTINVSQKNKNKQIYGSFFDMLNSFNFFVDNTEINKEPKIGLYETIKISTQDISLILLKVSDNRYKIFVLEISNQSIDYQSELLISSTREDIIKILGNPLFYKKDGSVYIYNSFNDLMQINVVFNNNDVSKIQYILWDGI